MSSLSRLIEEGLIRRDVPLGPMTTYRSGGPASLFADVADVDGLTELIASGVTHEREILILGRGSNLVVSDSGFEGLAIHLGEGFSRIHVRGTTVTAGSSVPLPRLARASVDGGLTGLEFFVGIPGSVGGAVRQNAGCFGTETRDRLIEAEIINLHSGLRRREGPGELGMSYRHSNVATDDLVTEAVFGAEVGNPDEGRAELRRITRWRRDNQPGGTLNAGSVFKNPDHISAGELIDSLGLKGMRVGDVKVSEKHANFFVAGNAASSEDVYRLMLQVKDRVLELSGTKLEPEIQFIGFES